MVSRLANTVHLSIWADGDREQALSIIKKAKATLGTYVLVQPVVAVPNSQGRVIALGSRPNWLVEHAFVREPTIESVATALRWAVLGEPDSRVTTVERLLSEWMGCEVKEIDYYEVRS